MFSFLAKLNNYLSLVGTYVRFNTKAAVEYRAAFASQMLAMILNDCIWVVFWTTFFARFPVVHGWGPTEVITLWAVCAAGLGIGETVFGNSARLASLIAQGELDSWLMYPRAVLTHIILGKMNATAFGDALFGYGVYIGFAHPDLPHFLLFAALTLSVAVVFVGLNILSGSLSFIMGNATPLADQWRFAMVNFSTYPASLFDGPVRFMLYTIVPAGFVSYLPIEALRTFSLYNAGLSLLGSLAFFAISVVVFYEGLKRYESGNLMAMKG
jgi:ABC-2 type transport system permease protein